MLIFRTTDMAKWGAGKGSNLTPSEVDLNFWDHEERITELEDNPPVADQIDNITQDGSTFTIHLQSGATFGPFQLPLATFHWAGDFAEGTSYLELDEIRVGGVGRVLVLQDHDSEAPFDIDRQIGGQPVYFLLEELGIIFATTPIDASRDLDDTDFSRYHDVVPGSSGDDVLLTVPPESSDFMPQPGTSMDFEMQDPTAQIEIVPGAGVTVNSPASLRSRAQWSVISLLYKGGDVWTLTGDLEIA